MVQVGVKRGALTIPPKFPEIPVRNQMERYVSKIALNLQRLSFFSEIWKFRKLSAPFDIPFPLMLGPSFSRRDCRVSSENGGPLPMQRVLLYKRRFVITFTTPLC